MHAPTTFELPSKHFCWCVRGHRATELKSGSNGSPFVPETNPFLVVDPKAFLLLLDLSVLPYSFRVVVLPQQLSMLLVIW